MVRERIGDRGKREMRMKEEKESFGLHGFFLDLF